MMVWLPALEYKFHGLPVCFLTTGSLVPETGRAATGLRTLSHSTCFVYV